MRTLRRRWPKAAAALDAIIEAIPLRYRLRVEVRKNLRLDGDDVYGAAMRNQSRRLYTIRLDAGMSDALATDTICHEYAHLLSTFDHGPRWGIAFARVYRAATGEGTWDALKEIA